VTSRATIRLARLGQPLEVAAVGIADVKVRRPVFAQDHRHLAAAGGGGRAHVRPAEPGEGPARAGREVVIEDVGVVKFVGDVIEGHVARHPARRRHQAIVLGYRLRVLAVEVGYVNLAVRAILPFECNLGLCDSLAAERLDEVIRERMYLAPQGCAGVGFGNERVFVEGVGGLGLEVAVVAAVMRYCEASALVNAKPWT